MSHSDKTVHRSGWRFDNHPLCGRSGFEPFKLGSGSARKCPACGTAVTPPGRGYFGQRVNRRLVVSELSAPAHVSTSLPLKARKVIADAAAAPAAWGVREFYQRTSAD